MNEELRERFLKTAESWLCDGYHLDVRYLCVRDGAKDQLFGASIAVNPLPPKATVEFRLQTAQVAAGQIQLPAGQGLMGFLKDACVGRVVADAFCARFDNHLPVDYYSDNSDPNRPGVDLHLRVTTEHQLSFLPGEIFDIDTELRRTNPPFDGLSDLCGWLGLQNPGSSGRQSTIDIRINPPVDFGDELKLENDSLLLTFKALETLHLTAL